uniref:CUE domain-containing protein n=1 Tax=Rhizophora mucronata TaxID=61149 RepID=A0A2P2LPD5_RHIMU
MKPAVSTLNPYAASYIPLSKRKPDDKIEVPGVKTQSGNQHVWHGPAQQQYKASSVALKSQSAHGVSGSSSQKLDMTEEVEMDLDYLRMEFPGISDESLTGVYMANKGDLEATEDMLNQLVVNFFIHCI